MKLRIFTLAFLLLVAPLFINAQENEPVVIDEVIAQVNNDVVTLSMLRRASAEAVEAFKQEGVEEQKANEEIGKRQPQLVVSLIDEQLLTQKAKELGLDDAIEGEVNRELLRLAGEYKVKNLDDLYQLMRQSGVTPETVRRTLRLRYTSEFVLRQDCYSKIYFEAETPELQAYFEKNRDKFKKPETVELSEIFLELAGKAEPVVLERAKQIIAEARKEGANFAALAASYSERLGPDGRPVGSQTGGKVGKHNVPELQPEIVAGLKNVPAGGISEPIKTPLGFVILRVDARTAGSDATTFVEEQVRQARLVEKAEPARVAYMAELRKDAYIKIAEGYRPTVDPVLYKDKPPVAATANTTDDKKKKDKKKKQ